MSNYIRIALHEKGAEHMQHRPLIGITAGLNDQKKYQLLNRSFMDAIMAQGGLPVTIPLTADETILRQYVETCDGFLFSGGEDVDPLLFGQYQRPACGSVCPVRDANELALLKLLLQRTDKPVLGICRGMQVMNVALGGDLYQDLPSEYEGTPIAHRQKQESIHASHPVQIEPDTLLHTIVGGNTLMVNSLHHQAVHHAKSWRVTAVAPDGVIEAAELPGHPFYLAVQWHPERLWEHSEAHRNLFKFFVDACRKKAD